MKGMLERAYQAGSTHAVMRATPRSSYFLWDWKRKSGVEAKGFTYKNKYVAVFLERLVNN